MTYHLSFEPFFPDQRPYTHFTDTYFPNQLPFNSSAFYDGLRNLRVTDIMGPRSRILYERINEKKHEGELSEGNQKTDVFGDGERRKLIEEGKFDFSEFDEILRQRRLDKMK